MLYPKIILYLTKIEEFSMKTPIFHPCLIFRQIAASASKKAHRSHFLQENVAQRSDKQYKQELQY